MITKMKINILEIVATKNKKLLNYCLISGLVLFFNVFLLCESKAQMPYCPEYQEEARSETSKVFSSSKYKLQFQIPDNFRVIEFKKDWLAIQTPTQYHQFSCMTRNNIPSELDSSVDIRIDSAPSDIDIWIGSQMEHNSEGLRKVHRKITKNGATSFVYFSQGMYLTMNMSFLSPDNSKVITVSTNCLEPSQWKRGYSAKDILFDHQTFLLVTETISSN